MKLRILLSATLLTVAACEDKPTTNQNRPRAVVISTPVRGPNDPPPPKATPDPSALRLPVSRTFDGKVLEKHKGGFVFQGLSGKNYLLLPSHHITDKPPDELMFINYDQIKVGQTLRVRLSIKLPLVPVYVCEGVVLHGVKRPDGSLLGPFDQISD